MDRTKEHMSSLLTSAYLEKLRKNTARYTPEMVDLVEEDLRYGLTEEQTEIYMQPNIKFSVMKNVSECLRRNAEKEFIDIVFAHEELNKYQVLVALEFYEKGIPLKDIEAVILQRSTPKDMRTCYQAMIVKLDEVKHSSEAAPEYVKELVDRIEAAVSQIQFQEKRYDELNQKLLSMETGKKDDDVREGLVKKLSDTEANLSGQQDLLNQANSTIARLRDQMEETNREKKRMQTRIDKLEDKLIDKVEKVERAILGKESSAVVTEEPDVTPEPTNSEEEVISVKNEEAAATAKVFPAYYQVPVVDSEGVVIQQIPVERTVRKSGDGGVAGLFSKLGFRKKSRQDIVKLVAAGDLTPEQLVQIKNAMVRGLTEGQLVELINNNVAADKMKEIIEIAVLENSMED